MMSAINEKSKTSDLSSQIPVLTLDQLLGFTERDSVSTASAEEATLSTSDREKDVERSEKVGEQYGNTANTYNYKDDPENPLVIKRYHASNTMARSNFDNPYFTELVQSQKEYRTCYCIIQRFHRLFL